MPKLAEQTKTASPQALFHDVLHVAGDGDKARWAKLGAAYQRRDSECFSIAPNFMPLPCDESVSMAREQSFIFEIEASWW